MTAPLTAELFARAIIASALSYGDNPVTAATTIRGPLRRCMAPAAVGLHAVVGGSLERVAGVLNLSIKHLYHSRAHPPAGFSKARDAAAEAASYHLRTQELKARAKPCAEPADKPLRIPVEFDEAMPPPGPALADPEAAVFIFSPSNEAAKMNMPPAPRPAPSRPAAKPASRPTERAMPKGARLVNLGDGVQRIETKPIPERVARMAKQQLDRGADLKFVADCFDCDPEALKAAIEMLSTGEAA